MNVKAVVAYFNIGCSWSEFEPGGS